MIKKLTLTALLTVSTLYADTIGGEISLRIYSGIGLESGYKAIHLDSEDLLSGLVVDMDFEGPYAAVVWNF